MNSVNMSAARVTIPANLPWTICTAVVLLGRLVRVLAELERQHQREHSP